MAYQNDGTAAVTVGRQKLYEQVWSIPASRLAVLYGISDVGLAKVCKKYRIPRPPRGYWAKLRADKPVKKMPLPGVRGEEYATVVMKGWNMPDEAIQQSVASARQQPGEDSGHTQPPATSKIHPLVVAAQSQLAEASPDLDGLVRTDPRNAFDLHISPELTTRCLEIVTILIQRWVAQGAEFRVTTPPEDGQATTAMAVGPDEFHVRICETLDDSKPLSDPTRRTGRLALYISGDENRSFRRRWADTKTQRLERMINPLITTVLKALETMRSDRLDTECKQRQKQRVQAIRNSVARRKDADFGRRQQLMASVSRWHDAQRIRAYLEALNASIKSEVVHPVDEEGFREWLEWASWYADSIDPILRARRSEEQPTPPQNTPAGELDLTQYTRSVVDHLQIQNTDDLYSRSEDDIRDACDGSFGEVWNEITRVLEGLGYDVSKRRQASYWW